MTVAGLQALVLRDQLRPGAGSSTRSVLRTLARVIDVPWELALGADLSLPGVEGPRPLRRRVINRYVTRLQAAAAADPELSRAFVRVTGLIDRPQTLLHPRTARRVLRPHTGATQPAALGDSATPARAGGRLREHRG